MELINSPKKLRLRPRSTTETFSLSGFSPYSYIDEPSTPMIHKK